MTKPSKFWLYLGIVLVCSGVGVGFGAVLLAIYFWSDIKKTIMDSRSGVYSSGINANNWQNYERQSPKWYDEDTAEKMK